MRSSRTASVITWSLSKVALTLRLCTGGELFDRLAHLKPLTESDAAAIMKQVLAAVLYCHSNNIVHRDLKPQNMLFESREPNARLKVIDFGTSQVFDPSQKMQLKIGTPYYVSPEVLRRSYDSKCDIWSCGVILYILLCGYPPFDGPTQEELLQKIAKGAYSMKGLTMLPIIP
jgi:calcium-dependent protein kinase